MLGFVCIRTWLLQGYYQFSLEDLAKQRYKRESTRHLTLFTNFSVDHVMHSMGVFKYYMRSNPSHQDNLITP